MRRKAQLITKDVALTVSCPVCGVRAGARCVDRSGSDRGIHLERFQVVDSYNRLVQVSFAGLLDEQTDAVQGLGL